MPTSSSASLRPGPTTSVRLTTIDDGAAETRHDYVATEEPLELRLRALDGAIETLAVTMRTPGNDFDLAAGYLHSEGVISQREAIASMGYCVIGGSSCGSGDSNRPDDAPQQQYNILTIDLRARHLPRLANLARRGTISSSCGVCGKQSLDSLELSGMRPADSGPVVDARLLSSLPERLLAAQTHFALTGGLHAAGLFDQRGALLGSREDVGRHNAVDKVLGWALLQGLLESTPIPCSILVVSGRLSFEIVQKALAARIPIVVSVSAPSSLALDLAARFSMTIVGFVRGARLNLYCGEERIS